MVDKYVYMFGEKGDLDKQDEKILDKDYDITIMGFYKLGKNSGYLLLGTLEDLEDCFEMYFGLEIADDFLTEFNSFDFDDGEWLSNGLKWFECKKSSRKSIKESRETIKISIPSNKELIGFLRPMVYGLTSAQLMTSVGGNWAWIDTPTFDESGYMYIEDKHNHATKIQYDFAKVHTIDIDWGNHQIYFYTKGDVLMLHFYILSDEEFNFLINGDENLDGIVTRFGK